MRGRVVRFRRMEMHAKACDASRCSHCTSGSYVNMNYGADGARKQGMIGELLSNTTNVDNNYTEALSRRLTCPARDQVDSGKFFG